MKGATVVAPGDAAALLTAVDRVLTLVERALRAIRHAVARGVTLIDTGDCYGAKPGCFASAQPIKACPDVMPLIGARTRAQLEDALGARALSADPVTALELLVPRDAVIGSRYGAPHMAQLDSERP